MQKNSALIPFGGHSMVSNMHSVLVRRPTLALRQACPVQWHYTDKVDVGKALSEHDKFVQLLADENVEILYHDEPQDQLADAIFVHDPALITDHGVIILSMGKTLRHGEEILIKNKLVALQIPIIYELVSPGLAEGGDFIWLDEKTLLAGIGFRTNQEGVSQLSTALNPYGIQILAIVLL